MHKLFLTVALGFLVIGVVKSVACFIKGEPVRKYVLAVLTAVTLILTILAM